MFPKYNFQGLLYIHNLQSAVSSLASNEFFWGVLQRLEKELLQCTGSKKWNKLLKLFAVFKNVRFLLSINPDYWFALIYKRGKT